MNFVVGNPPVTGHPNSAYLVQDHWDDWFKFRTMYLLVVFDQNAKRHNIGSVKIGEKGLLPDGKCSPGKRAPSLPPNFNELGDAHFSLGQDDDYYESLNALGADTRTKILRALRDCAQNLEIFHRHRGEEVMQTSLLRSVSESRVTNRFNRLAHGNAVLTDFRFDYTFPAGGATGDPPQLAFQVTPSSEPPTNVHVIIGRNGVGKTRCLAKLTNSILSQEPNATEDGQISEVTSDGAREDFAGLVVVSFSPFDEIQLPPQPRPGIKAHRIGIRPVSPTQVQPDANSANDAVQSQEVSLVESFSQSFEGCLSGPRRHRLRDAIATLETDPLFEEANLSGLLEGDDQDLSVTVSGLFKKMSSGHKVVLLSITRLVELVDERTLVMLDEPEGHLHPPLLSAFVRALSDLLIKRNGVGIISTHSPVVLREVPKSCVWVLWRSGREARAARPEIETFGENVGILTREIFGLEVTHSGFHQLLRSAVNESGATYDSVLTKFDGQLGAEAQAIVRAMLAIKGTGDQNAEA